jgi:hypothetical protein
MAYPALVFLLAFALTAPFALWVHLRRTRWRAPDRAIVFAFTGILAILLLLSAISGYFYPYGGPGGEVEGLRPAAEACAARYAAARSAADTAGVDTLILMPAPDVPVPSCRMLRQARLPRCAPGSRCERLKARLQLPD